MGTKSFCPVCQTPLTEVGTPSGIFWKCEKCFGRGVAVEILRRTFTPESIDPLWNHASKGEGQAGANCPSCRNSMIEVKLSDRAEIKVDVCPRCQFVWFDAGETQNLVPRPVSPSKPPLPEKTGEAIAKEKAAQLSNATRRADFESRSPDEWWKQIAAFLGLPSKPSGKTPR